MLSRETRKLIAKSIDDGLDVAERKELELVLRESESARRFLARLKQDSKTLRALPAVTTNIDISAEVMRSIVERNLLPIPAPPVAHRQSNQTIRKSSLPYLATAAGLMLAVTGASFLFFTNNQRQIQRNSELSFARETPRKNLSPTEQPKKPETGVIEHRVESPSPTPEVVVKKTKLEEVAPPEVGPLPRVVEDSILTARPEVMPEIHAINIAKHRVSRFLNLTDLASTEPAHVKNQSEIRNELKADELIRLDLFCRDTRSAMDLLSTAFKARNTQVIVDQHLTDRFKKRQTTEIVLFTDVLTPEEVFQLLGEIAKNEMSGGESKGEFDTLVVAPFLPADLDMLGRILGAGAVLSKMPKQKTPIDLRKPLPAGTANHLAQSLTKMGGGSGLAPTPSTPKTEKLAFIGSYSPVNPTPSQSKEIKSYLERRGEKRPDSKPLMLVLRTIN